MEIHRSALLPNLLTIGNGICGFAALVRLGKIEVVDGELVGQINLTYAAYLILLGMLFDVFDGKLARLSRNGGSELGAQLDSLCDLVTFGLVPAYLITRLNLAQPQVWQKVVWFFALAYFLGALLRLARFNVENAPDESAHLAFKGLPTPAAAGCVASLVIFQRYLWRSGSEELRFFLGFLEDLGLVSDEAFRHWAAGWITYALTFLAPFLGYTMLADRLRYGHMGTRLFGRRQSFDFLVYLIFGSVLLAMVPEVVLPLAFFGYLLWTPVVTLYRYLRPAAGDPAPEGRRRRWTRVLVGLGSNLGDRRENLDLAVRKMAEHPAIRWRRRSRWRETAPVGGPPQGDYLNGVGDFKTTLEPRELLEFLRGIEEDLGRVRTVPDGPRTIDLDILFYGDRVIREDDLVIPHPRVCERGFVLEPLSEVAPACVHPLTGKTLREHWRRLRDGDDPWQPSEPLSGIDSPARGGDS